jgi:methylmalonyl-CoA mutase N-terminal domain/subunit
MFNREKLAEIKEEKSRWEQDYEQGYRDWRDKFTTISGEQAERLYTPADIAGLDYSRDLGFPGEYPYTRGVRQNMYRGRLWTMRQFAGFATARESNERYQFLLANGQTGLSVAFDMPTIMGYDSDHPRAEGEVGRCGVAIDSLQDMEILFAGIPLDQISTSMTINAPAAIIWAMYLAAAEKQGVAWEKLTGTIQNDILKEYMAQKSWIFPPEPSLRLITDTIAFAAKHVPKWNTISISGYHIREAGATAGQELAFTLANGFAYVEAGLKRGLLADDFAPRLSFFFNSHLDFFEEIAKMRVARRIWAKRMKEVYGAKDPRSWQLRFHTQTAGCSLTAPQPENNIIRTAFEALAAVLGGTQSLHTNSMDEVLALPSEKAVQVALRTQQIIAHETGVTNTIDPLAGSYYVESLTDKMELEAEKYFSRIEELGGVLQAIDKGFFQQEIAGAAYTWQRAVDRKEQIIVGVNDFINPGEKPEIELLQIDPAVEPGQVADLRKLKETRDNRRVKETLAELEAKAKGTDNLLPPILACVRSYATLGEIVGVLREVFGEYKEKPQF